MILKKTTPLLSLSLAILAIFAQALFADQITITNNTADPLIIAFENANEETISIPLNPNQSSANKTVPDLKQYIVNDWLTYHFGLDMNKLKSSEKKDGTEPTQMRFDDLIFSQGKASADNLSFYTLNQKDDSLVIRTFNIKFEYNDKNKLLNIVITGKTKGKL